MGLVGHYAGQDIVRSIMEVGVRPTSLINIEEDLLKKQQSAAIFLWTESLVHLLHHHD